MEKKKVSKYAKYFPLVSFAIAAVNFFIGSRINSPVLTIVGIMFMVFGVMQMRFVKPGVSKTRPRPAGFKYPVKATKKKYHQQQKNRNKK